MLKSRDLINAEEKLKNLLSPLTVGECRALAEELTRLRQDKEPSVYDILAEQVYNEQE